MSDWKDIVKTIAPILGTAIGGPFGGMATKFLAGALLDDEDASEDRIQELIMGQDPEILSKLKIANNAFKVQMRELNIKEEDLNTKDRSNARNLAKFNMWPHVIISTIFVSMFGLIIYNVFTGSLDLTGTQKDIALYLLGILSAGLVQIMNFWFGSSSGSKEKTNKLKI